MEELVRILGERLQDGGSQTRKLTRFVDWLHHRAWIDGLSFEGVADITREEVHVKMRQGGRATIR